MSNSADRAVARQNTRKKILQLKEQGLTNVAIGAQLSLNESTIRRILAASFDPEKDLSPSIPTFRISYKSYVDVPALTADAALSIFLNPSHEDGYKGGPVTIEKL